MTEIFLHVFHDLRIGLDAEITRSRAKQVADWLSCNRELSVTAEPLRHLLGSRARDF